MKLTNVHNLPDVFLNYQRSSKYDKGDADFSATGLIGSARISALMAKHSHELQEDVTDRIFSMFGTAMHEVVDAAATFRHISEERLFTTYKVDGVSYRVSGQIDLQEIRKDGGINLVDFKVTSVWTVRLEGGIKQDWDMQTAIYARLIHRNKRIWPERYICVVFRDWRKAEGIKSEGTDSTYPVAPAQLIKISTAEEMANPEKAAREVDKYIRSRIRAHVAARKAIAEGDEPEFCTPEERWTRPGKYAVHAKGRKTASKLCDTEQEAVDWIAAKGSANSNEFRIEKRADQHIRCEMYCPVSKWCNQLKAELLTKIVKGDVNDGNDEVTE